MNALRGRDCPLLYRLEVWKGLHLSAPFLLSAGKKKTYKKELGHGTVSLKIIFDHNLQGGAFCLLPNPVMNADSGSGHRITKHIPPTRFCRGDH